MSERAARGIRGATTVEKNESSEILEATKVLLGEIVRENSIDTEDITAAFFTVTTDLDAEFPATAAREFMGWTHVPMLCGHEINVPGRLGKCIRVMVIVNTYKTQKELRHVYLGGATVLRKDLLPQ
ncbi:MAG: chorismate mutase [Peptococcaceae bacterium BRH_c4a]|nr:MAG: chorismate mutase [Peptococcaceae bacterium BRH_c4a]